MKCNKEPAPDIYEAHLQYGYTLKDVAEYIGVHCTTMSRAIKKNEGEDEKWYYKNWPHKETESTQGYIQIGSKRIIINPSYINLFTLSK